MKPYEYPTQRVVVCFAMVMVIALAGCAPALRPFFQKMDSIPPGSGLVYLYRPLRTIDYYKEYEIKADGKVVAVLPSGGYYPVVTEPGKIEFTTSIRGAVPANAIGFAITSKGSSTVDVQAGHTYYVRVLGKASPPAPELVSPDIGEEEITDCTLVEPSKSRNPL